MTVADLIAELQNLPQDAEVMMTADYGDRVHTLQALPIEYTEEGYTRDTAYSASGLAVVDGEDEPDDHTNEGVVVFLK